MHKIQRRNISICFHFVENFIIRTDVKSKVRFLEREQKRLYIRFLVEKISWISKIGTNYSLNKHRFDKIIILNEFCRWNYFAMANIKFVRKKIQFGLMLSTFRPDSICLYCVFEYFVKTNMRKAAIQCLKTREKYWVKPDTLCILTRTPRRHSMKQSFTNV